MKLSVLLGVLSPSTKVYVFDHAKGKFIGGTSAISLLSVMEREGGDGVIEHMTVGAGRVNLYLKKLD